MIALAPTSYVPRYLTVRAVRRRGFRGLGDPGAAIPNNFTGNWTPPSSFGTLVSSPINLTAADWSGPENLGQSPYWNWATNKGQQIGQDFWNWDTWLTSAPGDPTACGRLYGPGYNNPPGGPSISSGNALVSSPSDPFSPHPLSPCSPSSSSTASPSPASAPAPSPVSASGAAATPAPSLSPASGSAPVAVSSSGVPASYYSQPSGGGWQRSGGGGSSGFSLSAVPWWGWAGAAAIALLAVTN